MGRIVVLSSDPPASADRAIARFATFLGLESVVVPVGSGPSPTGPAPEFVADAAVVAIGFPTLRHVGATAWFSLIAARARFVLVHGCAGAAGSSQELAAVTGGAVLGSTTLPEPGMGRVSVHVTMEFVPQAVCGHEFFAEPGSARPVLAVASNAPAETWLSVDGHPRVVAMRRGGSWLVLLADETLPDVDARLAPNASLRPWYPGLIALALFFRRACGDRCWTSPLTAATFTVDDPYLRWRYGFIRYSALTSDLVRTQSALSIGFIPFNYHRSDRRTVELLSRYPDHFSIAVHGCDHTDSEFANPSEEWLAGTATCALERMEAHARRTGMAFDKVMIFPQGRFSGPAIRALKRAGFTAAVNSTPWPVNSQEGALRLGDLLDVAVTQFSAFPIFVRRYPRDLFDHAFDVLFQKPVLAVEHHGYFRDAHREFVRYVGQLRALRAPMAWMPIGRAVASACVIRRSGDDQFTLRHYCPDLVFKNPTAGSLSLRVEKRETDGAVDSVVAGGRQVPFELASGFISYRVNLGAGEELRSRVLYRPTPEVRRATTVGYRIAASTRRMLSEARDNWLARSPAALSIAQKVKDLMSGAVRPEG